MVALCWLRRDLRLSDQAALYHVLRSGLPVITVFIFDKNILDDLENRADKRLQFIHDVLEQLQQQLVAKGSTLDVFYGTPEQAFAHWTQRYKVKAVFTNHDYEHYARERDAAVGLQLKEMGISFHTYKDQVIFEKDEVVKDNGEPYTVFTPYSKKWKVKLNDLHLKPYPAGEGFYRQEPLPIPALSDMGFEITDSNFPDTDIEYTSGSGYRR
jgi:deoxyribodipyrimidine photo-lyase